MTKQLTARALAVAAAGVIAMLGISFALGQRDDDGPPPSETTSTSESPATTAEPSTPTTVPPTPTTFPPTTLPPSSVTVPPSSGPAIAVRRGPTTNRVVALTFDAGSDTGYTAEILDTLAAHHVVATFGLTGRWAEANPTLVRRIVKEGHQVVNHTYDHPSFTGYSTDKPPLSRADRLGQLARADEAIRHAGGEITAPWFRPPYGDEDESVRADVARAGFRYELLWTVDSLGWRGVPPNSVVARCLDSAVPGAIYLFHVGSASTDHAALQQIIDGLRVRDYRFATASGLLGATL